MSNEIPSTCEYKVVRIAELPHEDSMVFKDSSFFQGNVGDLPSPEQVRQRDAELNGPYLPKSARPPIPFEDLGLMVKYGWNITVAEAQCLWYFNRHMRDEVPTPELFGWRSDGGQTFIYMQLVRGQTLEEAWPSLSEQQIKLICEQLRRCVTAWRRLRQESEPYFIGKTSHSQVMNPVLTVEGHIGGQGVGDIIFSDAGDANAGPFENLTAFHNFFARYSCRRHPEWNPRRDFPELVGLTDDRPVVFTHADLNTRNIMVSSPGNDPDSTPKVIAILDWHQSGWYPDGWEWLKAQWMCEPLEEGGRDTAWLEQVLDRADEGYSYAWEYINSCL